MNIVVCVKRVPETADADLSIDQSGRDIDNSGLVFDLNEWDSYALEEAILLKEKQGGAVTVLSMSGEESNETLRKCLAMGADDAIRLTDPVFNGSDGYATAKVLAAAIQKIPYDLILTGTQAVDDLDGFVGALLAERMELPYVGYVTKVEAANGKVVARKEYPGGLNADIEVSKPAVLGIQAAEKPPRYVVTSKVMEAMKSATIDESQAPDVSADTGMTVSRMLVPETGAHAEMIEGTVEAVAAALVKVLRERDLIA